MGELVYGVVKIEFGLLAKAIASGPTLVGVEKEDRINVRVDYAWGRSDSALYISIAEAF